MKSFCFICIHSKVVLYYNIYNKICKYLNDIIYLKVAEVDVRSQTINKLTFHHLELSSIPMERCTRYNSV